MLLLPLMLPKTGLIIESYHMEKVLNGSGSWEMRTGISHKSEPIALINSGINYIVGVANLIAVNGTVDYALRKSDVHQHRIADECIQARRFDKWDVIWTLDQVQRLHTPIPLYQTDEAETWVNLDAQVQEQLASIMRQQPKTFK